jgi:hypothetical protein
MAKQRISPRRRATKMRTRRFEPLVRKCYNYSTIPGIRNLFLAIEFENDTFYSFRSKTDTRWLRQLENKVSINHLYSHTKDSKLADSKNRNELPIDIDKRNGAISCPKVAMNFVSDEKEPSIPSKDSGLGTTNMLSISELSSPRIDTESTWYTEPHCSDEAYCLNSSEIERLSTEVLAVESETNQQQNKGGRSLLDFLRRASSKLPPLPSFSQTTTNRFYPLPLIIK